jgi:EAL domain-containing protein (putative c-di-GMP-specific phosphodiesterase class I)
LNGQAKRDGEAGARILIVDDDAPLAKALAKALAPGGYRIEIVHDGREAVERASDASFDVVISDIQMPEMNGLELLLAIRRSDLDVPIILVTGDPSMETAMQAVRYGAFRYLLKPLDLQELQSVTSEAIAMHRLARVKRELLDLAGQTDKQLGDLAGLKVGFERALGTVWIAFQPIVRWSSKNVYGYEALLRTNDPTLPHPGAMFDAAERLGRVHDLGQLVRRRVAERLREIPDSAFVFVNLHTSDLDDKTLFSEDAPLAIAAERVVLEITERANLDTVSDVSGKVGALRQQGYRIAIDDLGAGYAGLTSFAQLVPEVVKIDMSLVRNIDHEPVRRRLVGALAGAARELKMLVVAEGVETREERDSLVELGVDLFQGFLFARPQRELSPPRFD